MAVNLNSLTGNSSSTTIIFSALALLLVQWFIGKMFFGKDRWEARGKVHLLKQ
jgi:hypothetical protein